MACGAGAAKQFLGDAAGRKENARNSGNIFNVSFREIDFMSRLHYFSAAEAAIHILA
jgi:hypothetical protein